MKNFWLKAIRDIALWLLKGSNWTWRQWIQNHLDGMEYTVDISNLDGLSDTIFWHNQNEISSRWIFLFHNLIIGLALSPPLSQHLQPHQHQLSYTLSTSQHNNNNNLLTTTIAMQQQQNADRSSSPVRGRHGHQDSGTSNILKSSICYNLV